MNTSAFAVIAREEIKCARTGRLVHAFVLLLTLLCVGISLAGLGATGQLLVQGFTRTSVSLLSVILYLLPLFGLLLGSTAFGHDDGGTELLLAQPVTRRTVICARLVGLGVVAIGSTATAFGIAAVMILARAGFAGIGGYVLVFAASCAAALWGLAVGALIGVIIKRKTAAVGTALAAWLMSAVIYDLLAIGTLQLLGDGQPGRALVALLAFNPIDGLRTLLLVQLGADVLLGPTGAALQQELGRASGSLWILGSLALWLAACVTGATRVFAHHDC
jgi:Cu-processing system permease protein